MIDWIKTKLTASVLQCMQYFKISSLIFLENVFFFIDFGFFKENKFPRKNKHFYRFNVLRIDYILALMFGFSQHNTIWTSNLNVVFEQNSIDSHVVPLKHLHQLITYIWVSNFLVLFESPFFCFCFEDQKRQIISKIQFKLDPRLFRLRLSS